MTDPELIDAAGKLMGWQKDPDGLFWYTVTLEGWRESQAMCAVWNPLERIEDAWGIVELMVSKMGYNNQGFNWQGPCFKPEHRYLSNYPLGTTCWYVELDISWFRQLICADTAPRAIVFAALKAAGVEVM
jgi:hypothetical protein